MITKDEFIDWKKNSVTQAFFATIVEKINEGATELSYSAGVSPIDDRYKVGAIHAYRAVLDVDFGEFEGASDNA